MRSWSRRVKYAVLAASSAGAAAVAVVVGVSSRNDGPGRAEDLPPAVRDRVTLKARDAVEGGAAPYLGSRLACAVRLLGIEPPAVTTADQVKTAYVWVLCGTRSGPTESSLPLAVHLTDSPTAEVPGDGSANGPDKERIFPKRLWDAVFNGPDDIEALDEEMKQRRQALADRD